MAYTALAAAVIVAAATMAGGCGLQSQEGTVPPIAETSPPTGNTDRFSVTVSRPASPPQVFTGMYDGHGEPITVSCTTCHTTRTPDATSRANADLNEFHTGLSVAHGNLACLSCHNPADYDSLKLADGTRIEFPDVMQLCAQCHSQQLTDFEHGAHGGMNGYWDLSRGPRTRKNCVDCHAPHTPRFPMMIPTFRPRDRFTDLEHQE